MIFSYLKSIVKKNQLIYHFYFKYFYDFYHETNDTFKWLIQPSKNPPPGWIKHRIIINKSIFNSTFVETGTFRGSTLVKVKKNFKKIYSFEPSEKFYKFSKKRLKNFNNIKIINSTSEKGLQLLLKKISGNVTFWLDGHYSGGETFCGKYKTPIKEEIKIIIKLKKRFKKLVIFIDDYRLFGRKPYPNKKYLINICKRKNFKYEINNDIFIINIGT